MSESTKWILLGYFLLIHSIVMLYNKHISFGWDIKEVHGFYLYIAVIPYMLFAFGIIIMGVMKSK